MEMTKSQDPYIVLARKYRPEKFSELVGQQTLVRVIANSIKSNQMAHAFILTGVRGVGKTTTARLIAKSLNCVGEDGNGMPTVEVCGVCNQCQSIAKGTHIDILEMDAASRTGVDDIREIIETVKFQPNSARYKVYIIDEVHMLSKPAFNAILKTLEEPPDNVKFVFATTEIRKVPVTILSRCQRFDLRRIAPEVMISHLTMIAEKEKVQIEDDSLMLIARASEGSVRDAISLMDQAIAFCEGKITADNARQMLGLADRSRILDLVELILIGDAASALKELNDQYHMGADPKAILMDLADTVHWLTVGKVSSEIFNDPSFAVDVRQRGKDLADKLNHPILVRYWQMILKVLREFDYSPDAMQSAEMAIVRLTSVSNLPTPIELVNKLTGTTNTITKPDNVNISRQKSPSPSPDTSQKLEDKKAKETHQKDSEQSETRVDNPSASAEKAASDTQPKKSMESVDREKDKNLQQATKEEALRNQQPPKKVTNNDQMKESKESNANNDLLTNALVKGVLDVFPDADITTTN